MNITEKKAKQWLALTLAALMNLTALPTFARPQSNANSKAVIAEANLKTNITKASAQVQENFGKLPLSFEANQGQAAATVKYLARGNGHSLSLTGSEAIFNLRNTKSSESLRMKLAGANTTPQVSGLDELAGKSNYFIGSNPQQWHTNVPNFARVQYRNVYPGVDLIYYGNQRELEYDFIVAPGVDPEVIRLRFDGARSLRLDNNGDLLIKLSNGELRQHKPVIYQELNGARHEVTGRYVIRKQNGQREIGFAIGSYDRNHTLVIDPVLVYSTYLGGSAVEFGQGIAVDSNSNVYVAGFTTSTNFPSGTRVPTGSTGGGGDAFVIKLNAAGTQLLYSAYIGGTNADAATDIALDSSNNAWVAGYTNSTNFPTQSPRQSNNGGGPFDAFVIKLDAAGSALSFATYLGGSGDDQAFDVAVDSTGEAVVVGQTNSANFPTVNQRQGAGGGIDGFVTRYNSTGASVVHSTYHGGAQDDVALAVTVDASRNAYVAGYTASNNFPTQTPFQQNIGGARDAFVSKFNAAGSALTYSTYLGGSFDDEGYGIAVDGSGNAYVSGLTSSANFPTRTPVQTSYGGGGRDAFATKLNASGNDLVYSTWLGGKSDDYGSRIAVDSTGSAYITGNTFSTNFPIINILPAAAGAGSDAFVVRLNAAGTERLFSSYLGGNADDFGNAIALDGTGNVYVTGVTASTSFPTLSPLQASNGASIGVNDAFITKINPNQNLAAFVSVSAASFAPEPLAPESIAAGFGANLTSGFELAATQPLPTALAGVRVRVRDSNGVERDAGLFGASGGQINYEIPKDTANGRATVTVVNSSNNNLIAAGVISVGAIGMGLFTGDASGGGAPAAYGIRVNGSEQSLVQTTQGATPVLIDLGGANEQIFLILFGTGIRGRSNQNNVRVNFVQNGNTVATTNVEYASIAPGFTGLDQINLIIPRSLVGRGIVDLNLSADGQQTNNVKLNFK